MPDLAGAFVRHHAGADGVLGDAVAVEELAVVRVLDPGHYVAADALMREVRRRVVPQLGDVDRELLPRVEVRELVAKPEVAVRHVRDAAPASAERPEDAPQLRLRVQ